MPKSKSVKVTYSLPSKLVDDLRNAVKEGSAPSYSAFVEDALRRAVDEAREKMLAAEFAEAAGDEEFLADIDEVASAFEAVDTESARKLP
jgi:Arc/MetJ-type ribon-helix-helix transcriptional regulator